MYSPLMVGVLTEPSRQPRQGGVMYAKVVVVELWYGFCEEIYCIIEHPLILAGVPYVFD